MMAAEGLPSMMAAEGDGERKGKPVYYDSDCIVRNCRCFWQIFSPQNPRVAPGQDYSCIPPGADHRPAWSVLVGIKDGDDLRLKRLRVARSGRILGRSDDALEAFHDVKAPTDGHYNASVALAPDGRSICVLCHDACAGEQPHALQLTLQPQQTQQTETSQELLPLPEIQGMTSLSCMSISVEGQIWALCAIVKHRVNFSLFTQSPLPGSQWRQVGDSRPHKHQDYNGGGFLQGYAVLPGPLILVSFRQEGVFFTFAPNSSDWTPVLTDETRPPRDYLPILGRGVYMEQDKAIYILRHNTIYAYKLSYIHQDDDQGRQQLRLDPPITVGSVCPFDFTHGYGFLTRLDGRLMCSVWINLVPHYQFKCQCDNLHAIVTTFHLNDPSQGGINVLHSSFRRVDMEPNPRDQEFAFLQEYEDKDSLLLLQHEGQEDVLTSSQKHVDEPSMMLHCCREFITMGNRPLVCFRCGVDGHSARDCFLLPQGREPSSANRPLVCFRCGVDGHSARDCFLLPQEREPSSAMPPWVGRGSVQHLVPFSRRPVATTTIKKDLCIICKADSQLIIYQTGVMDATSLLEGGDGGEPLQPSCHVPEVADDDYLHFFQHASKIHAVSSKRDDKLEFRLNKDRTMAMDCRPVRRPIADPFVLVITVGGKTIALTEKLKVFHQARFSYGLPTWLCYTTDQSHVCSRKVKISGYVALNDNSFIVCDALTCSCLLFDLVLKQWRVVMPWAAFEDDLPTTTPGPNSCLLNGRCVFVDGFIYTCRDGGLAAYELLLEDHCVYLSKPILLPFSWLGRDCLGEDMCLDYAGKDVDSGAILFYVVHLEGGYLLPKHDVQITIVQVKTKTTPSGEKREPVGVDPVDCVTRSIRHHNEAVYTRCCFAVSCL